MTVFSLFKNRRRAHILRRALQVAVSVGALVPVLAGLAGIGFGPGMIVDTVDIPDPALDSHYRYLSGLLLGVGLGFWTTVADIENQTSRFRLLAVIVFIGGLGRLYSLLTVGWPDRGMQYALAMELIVTPLLALWQYRVARRM